MLPNATTSSNTIPAKPRIRRSTFNMVVRLRAEGFSWEDIATEVALPVAEIKRYPERRQAAWDEELARNARRATLAGVVQAVGHWHVMMSTNTPKTYAELTDAVGTLAALLPLVQPPKPKRKYTPRKPKAKPAVEVEHPVEQPADVVPVVPVPNVEVVPTVSEPATPDTTLPPVKTPPSPTLFTALRVRMRMIFATVRRWVRGLTPRFILRC